ncbi:MAG: cell division protein FtsK, partial [Betaproteobacteria bacterium CG2_30_59_46]
MALDTKPSYRQNARGTNRRAPPEPLSPKMSGLLREARWLVVVAVALYLALVLFSYDHADPGWSHSGSRLSVHNTGGEVGAWLADMLLYVFGFSAYWWVAFSLYVVWWGYRRIESAGSSDRRSLFVAVAGFVILLLSCSGLEALRLHSLKAVLPLAPGGMIGAVASSALATSMGFTGATLILLLSMAVGFSLFTGMSWLKFMEGLGGAMENSALWIIQTWDAWKDRRAGSVALNQREEIVAEEKKRFDDHPPIHIEPSQRLIPQIPLTEREVQAPLFDNLPDSPLPPLNLLDEAGADTETLNPDTLEFTSRLIERKLADFGVAVKVIAAYPGPVITRYEIEPAVGVKGSQITNLVRDLARALSVISIRLVETIPGKNCMGLEIPNPKRQIVRLREILGSKVYADMASPLTIAMGKDIAGKAVVADLGKMPHVLVAGTTGSGKSVAINAMILSLVYKADPAKVRLILVDPKMLELSVYEGIPHLLAPVVTDMKHAANALNWCVAEMERRYRLMSALGVRNLAGYNQKVREAEKSGAKLPNPFSLTPDAPEPLEEMPFIVVLIDELADMMMVVGKKV